MNETNRRANSVVVKNLPIDCDQNQLENLFSRFGRIVSIKILPSNPNFDGGCGFINFGDSETAQKAIEQMNNVKLNGFFLRVTQSMSRTNGNHSERSLNNFRNNVSSSDDRRPLTPCNSSTQRTEDLRSNSAFNGNHIENLPSRSSPKKSDIFLNIHEHEALNKNQIYTVYLSNLEAPNMIFIATIEDYLNATNLIIEMNKNESTFVPLKAKPTIGQICAALFNGEWYRARVLKVEENRVFVEYVDWGNTNWCKTFEEIRLLPSEFYRHSALCSKCFLDAIPDDVQLTQEQTAKLFQTLVVDVKLEMKIVRIEKNRRFVTLNLDGRNLNSEVEKIISRKISIEEKNLLSLNKLEIYPFQLSTMDESAESFYGSIVGDQLSTIADILRNWEKNDPIAREEVRVKSLVCAQYDGDKLWYRAWIEEIRGDFFHVFFVDFGNRETVDLNRLSECPKVLRSIPWQSVRIRLASMDLSTDEKLFLLNKFENQTLSMKIVEIHDKFSTVDLSLNGKSLKHFLLEQREKKQNQKIKSPQISSSKNFLVEDFLFEQRRQNRILEQIAAAVNSTNALIAQFLQRLST